MKEIKIVADQDTANYLNTVFSDLHNITTRLVLDQQGIVFDADTPPSKNDIEFYIVITERQYH